MKTKNRPSLLLLVLLLVSTVGLSNPSDSLRQAYRNASNDSTRIELCNELGNQWIATSIDSSLKYFKLGLDISIAADLREETAMLLMNQSFAYRNARSKKLMEESILDAVAIYQNQNDTTGEFYAYFTLGSFEFSFEDFSSAKSYLLEAVKLGEKIDELENLAKVYNNVGLAYQYLGSFDKSIEYKLKGLEIREKNGFTGIESSLVNIGLEHHEQGEYADAIPFYERGLEILRSQEPSGLLVICLKNMGQTFARLNREDLAKKHFDESLALAKQFDDSLAVSHAYIALGDLEITKKTYLQAESLYLQAQDWAPKINALRLEALLYRTLSDLYVTMADGQQGDKNDVWLQNAIGYGKKSLERSLQLSIVPSQLSAAYSLMTAYERLGDDTKALEYAKMCVDIKDSLYSLEKTDAIADVEGKYKTEQKELEIELLSKDNRLKEKDIEAIRAAQSIQKNVLLAVIFGLLVSTVLVLLLLSQTRKRKEANARLKERNNTIASQNEEKELLLKEIHHRVKNNLQVISSLLDLQSKNIEDESALSAVSDGQNRVKAMALIHHNLYQNENLGSIPFKEYARQLLKQVASIYPSAKNVNCTVSGDTIQLDIDTAVPVGLILNELVSNAFKYAFEETGGTLNITMVKLKDEDYRLEVQDNGPGLPTDFDIDSAKSLGLRLVRRLSKQLYGKALYVNNHGACFTIRFKDTLQRKDIA